MYNDTINRTIDEIEETTQKMGNDHTFFDLALILSLLPVWDESLAHLIWLTLSQNGKVDMVTTIHLLGNHEEFDDYWASLKNLSVVSHIESATGLDETKSKWDHLSYLLTNNIPVPLYTFDVQDQFLPHGAWMSKVLRSFDTTDRCAIGHIALMAASFRYMNIGYGDRRMFVGKPIRGREAYVLLGINTVTLSNLFVQTNMTRNIVGTYASIFNNTKQGYDLFCESRKKMTERGLI